MGVGRAQDAADQHTRHRQVRPVLREPRHLGHAVRTNRPGPDPFELLYRFARSDFVHSYPRLIAALRLTLRRELRGRRANARASTMGLAMRRRPPAKSRFGLDRQPMLD